MFCACAYLARAKSQVTMSLYRWLVSPSGLKGSYIPAACREGKFHRGGKQVACELERCDKKKRVRGEYHHYTAETRAKIAKYACESGNKAAFKKYSMELGHAVSEGTVRNFKHKYLKQLKSVGDPDLINSLPSAAVGRPLLIGKFDDDVAEYVCNLCLYGGIVNSNIL
jgi:hypothetical protein